MNDFAYGSPQNRMLSKSAKSVVSEKAKLLKLEMEVMRGSEVEVKNMKDFLLQ